MFMFPKTAFKLAIIRRHISGKAATMAPAGKNGNTKSNNNGF